MTSHPRSRFPTPPFRPRGRAAAVLVLCMACTTTFAQETPRLSRLSESDTAALARLGQAIADSTLPLLLETSADLCAPVIVEGADLRATAETVNRKKRGLGEPLAPTLPGLPLAWAQNGNEYIPPEPPATLGTYRDTGTYAVLHAGVGPDGVCTVAWQVTDMEEAGDPHDEAKHLYRWIDQMEGFRISAQDRDGARWDNTENGTFLSLSSNEDDVIFLHFGRR